MKSTVIPVMFTTTAVLEIFELKNILNVNFRLGIFLYLRLHAACANVCNNKNVVIFIFVIAVEYEINFIWKISRTTVYHCI